MSPAMPLPIINPLEDCEMQSTPKPKTLQDMLKRQNEMQYAAMAHAQAGQQLPDDFTQEYTELEQEIAKLTAEKKK